MACTGPNLVWRFGLLARGLLLVCGWSVTPALMAADYQRMPWGLGKGGQAVEKVTLSNDTGMRVSYIDYGATITAIVVPDASGQAQNVVLSLPNLPAYEQTKRRFSAIMGRYAGRIAQAKFQLDGREIVLIPGANGATLHSDPDGYDKRVWQRRDFSTPDALGSVFQLISPAGDQGLPGRLRLDVTYRLSRREPVFEIEYRASTDAPTILNLTNHAFFNLAGAGNAGLASHRFQLFADRYAETDRWRVPTGVISPVAGTPLDFRQPSSVMDGLRGGHALLGSPAGYDHSLLVARSAESTDNIAGALALVAIVDEASSGRRMEIFSTEPAVQFNTGNGFDGTEVGSEGRAYLRHDGFAIETQHLPDSPNHAHFPSTILRPGEQFYSLTRYRFSTLTAKLPSTTP